MYDIVIHVSLLTVQRHCHDIVTNAHWQFLFVRTLRIQVQCHDIVHVIGVDICVHAVG